MHGQESLPGRKVVTSSSSSGISSGAQSDARCFEALDVMISTAVLGIPEGCVLVGPLSLRILIFSDHILTILHAMYLVSNKVASN